MRFRSLALLLVASVLIVPAAFAHEPPATNAGGAGETCEASPAAAPDDESFNGRFCRNVAEFARLRGDLCRDVEDDDPCAYLDGRSITEESVAEYEASWVHRALAAQRALDDIAPLAQALWPHTHNSYNSSWYPTRIANSDPNQLYSLEHQLRMDMRILELDIHWHANQVVLCHGEVVGPAHAGCSSDRTLAEGLAEIRAWLDANPHQVIGVYLENKLDGNVEAHNAAVAAITHAEGLQGLVYRPSSACAALPAETVSRAKIRNSGARVFLVGNKGPGDWCDWVHHRDEGRNGATWWESSSGFGTDFPAYPECIAYLADPERAGSRPWTRIYEDGTWLSQMGGGGGEVTAIEAERMVTCGVTMPGFDHLDPHDQARLGALVWSWAAGEPAGPGCAYQGADARLHTSDCKRPRQVACRTSTGEWTVTRAKAGWDRASRACSRIGATFTAPWNGLQNRRLADASAGREVWINHTV